MKKIALLLLVVVLAGKHLCAQNTGGNPSLAAFDALRNGDEVVVKWIVKSGFSCAAVNVLHSTDSITFTSIYEYPGICGASSVDESYSFTHTAPSSGKNYYKMDLGSYGTSAVVMVEMVFYGTAGFVITGSPGTAHKVYFSNAGNAIFTLELFNTEGKLLYTKQDIEGDNSEIPAMEGTDVVIILRLSGNDGRIYHGKYLN
jgi:hypothetical protein